MRALLLVGPGVALNLDLLRQGLKEDVTKNSYPKEEGIAVFDCGREPDWAWAEYTIVAGECEIGRHHFDLKIGKAEDIASQVIDTLSVLEDSTVDEGTDAE